MDVKEEINKAIGVINARKEFLTNWGDISFNEWNAFEIVEASLKSWRDEDSTKNIPEIARQRIWLNQCLASET